MTNKKFAFGKAYNVTVNGEGLDINQATVEFCIMQEGFSVVLPLRHVKESVFELKIPATLSSILNKKTDIDFSISVKKDNLCFEVMKESFDIEYFKVKSVKIEEARDEEVETLPEITPEAIVISEATVEPIVEKKEEPVHVDTGSSKDNDLKNAFLESIKGIKKVPTPSQSPPPKLNVKRLRDMLKH